MGFVYSLDIFSSANGATNGKPKTGTLYYTVYGEWESQAVRAEECLSSQPSTTNSYDKTRKKERRKEGKKESQKEENPFWIFLNNIRNSNIS